MPLLQLLSGQKTSCCRDKSRTLNFQSFSISRASRDPGTEIMIPGHQAPSNKELPSWANYARLCSHMNEMRAIAISALSSKRSMQNIQSSIFHILSFTVRSSPSPQFWFTISWAIIAENHLFPPELYGCLLLIHSKLDRWMRQDHLTHKKMLKSFLFFETSQTTGWQ